MEPETLFTKQDDSCKTAISVKASINEINIEEKLKENDLEIDVVVVDGSQQPVIVHEPFVPDLTLFSYEVQQGYRIFRELLSDQYKSITYPFISPVDVEGLNLWDYHARIETPMSFSKIEDKFKSYLYQSITEVISDMRLILENCYRYNGSTHWISKLAHKLEKIIDQKLALLNRSLRDKVTLRATMAFRNKKVVEEIAVEEPVSVGRPRRSGRTSYVNGMNPEESSSLMNHLLLEEEENQKETKRLKEKERKEANEALMQELSEWESEIFPSNVLKDLRSMWEIPTIGSFLWLFHPALNLPELNFTEFEYGFILPHKSQQMAWIFTTLLVTPNQRKSLHKKSPMKFRVWERKLKERMDVWYLAKQDDELQMVARQIGLDPAFFEILGETNPLEAKSYVDLTLHQRVLILKVLCDECLDYHPQLRDFLGTSDTTAYSETYLGYDGQNATYLYFPIFDATDIRVYKQAELRPLNEWYRKWTSNSKTVSGSYQTPKRTNQSRSRRSSTPKSAKKSKGPSTTIEPGFELVCNDVESLRILCEKFAEPPTTPSRRKSGSRPTRKRSEKELHRVLTDLVEDLGKSDARYSRGRVKGLLNLMKEWKSVEEISDSGDEFNDQDGDIEEEAGNCLQPSPENEVTIVSDNIDTEVIPGEAAPLLSIVTRSRNRKRKFPDYDDMTSTSSSPVSEVSKNFESELGGCDDSPDSRVEIRSEKHRTLENDVVQDSIVEGRELCDVIVRGVIDDVISKVLASENTDVWVMNGVNSEGQRTTTVTQNGGEKHSVDTMDIISNGMDVEKNEGDHGVSMDNKEHQSMETNGKNSDTDENRDTAMDIDGFENRPNHATSENKISNGSAPITNGIAKGHEEESMDVYTRSIDDANEHKSSKHFSGQNCPETQEINGGITGTQRTDMYNNGQCGEPTNDVCDDDRLNDSHNTRTNIPTENEPTRTILMGKESTGMIPIGVISTGVIPGGKEHTGKEPTRMVPTEIKSTVKVPEEKYDVSSTGIRNQSPTDTVTT